MATITKRKHRAHDSCDDSSRSQRPKLEEVTYNTATGKERPVSNFQYRDLEYGKPCFRLLRLISRSGPLRCELIHQTFQGGTFVPYEAISYVWGPPDRCETLIIGDAELPITAGLCSMLKRLRARRHQYIWGRRDMHQPGQHARAQSPGPADEGDLQLRAPRRLLPWGAHPGAGSPHGGPVAAPDVSTVCAPQVRVQRRRRLPLAGLRRQLRCILPRGEMAACEAEKVLNPHRSEGDSVIWAAGAFCSSLV